MNTSQVIFRRRGEPFGSLREPTMQEILSDPIVRAVIRADNVDPNALERRLRIIGAKLASAEPAADRSIRGSSTEI
jgi:hypothetical protein